MIYRKRNCVRIERFCSRSPVARLELLVPDLRLTYWALAVVLSLTLLSPALSIAGNYDGSAGNAPPVSALVDKLDERLAADSEDFSGWLLLMQSYLHLNQPGKAKRALDRARVLAEDNADELVRLANAIEGSGAALGVSPGELTQKALALDPNHPGASTLVADRVMQGDPPTIGYLGNLLDGQAPAPAQADAASALPIRVHVSLSEKLRTDVQPSDTVFVYVKSASAAMPLSVVRKQVKDLPVQVIFDESTAMIKGHTLSADDTDLEVVARVSRSGETRAQKGDLQGIYSGFSGTHSDTIEVVVDTLLN